jgi:hypothetical protein
MVEMIGKFSFKALVITLGFLALSTTSVKALEWKASCGSKYSNWFGTYTFHVKQGEVGGCPSDKKAQHSWKFSERSEVKSKGRIAVGQYKWSAIIDIERNCKPAYRNTLFQVHDASYMVAPPSWFGINEFNRFRTDDGNVHNGKSTWDEPGDVDVPTGPFELVALLDVQKRSVKVDYYVNGNFVTSTHDTDGPFKELYLKFGSYRVNSNCDLTQTYTKVRFKRQ